MPSGLSGTTDGLVKKPLSPVVVLVIKLCIAAALSYGAIRGTSAYIAKHAALQNERVQSSCPTLFSVARTPRDTLLVMRSESMCIEYVLKTLK